MTIAKPKFTGIPEAIASKPFRLLERSCRRWQLKVVVIDLREPLLSRHAPQVLIPASNPNRPHLVKTIIAYLIVARFFTGVAAVRLCRPPVSPCSQGGYGLLHPLQ